jgi:preprotein translocase subunit YajC
VEGDRALRCSPIRTGADGVVQVDLRKLLILLVVALVLFFLISQPTESATLVHNVLNALKKGAEALITFVKSVFA